MNINLAINQGSKILKNKSIPNPKLDSEILLAKTINKDRNYILLNSDNILNKKHINFTDALSFHEANILTNTLLQLKQQGVVAYPIHDCVLVKEKHQSIAVKTFRAEFSKYVATYQSKNNLSYLTLIKQSSFFL